MRASLRKRIRRVTLLASALLALAAPVAQADEAAPLFDPGAVTEIALTLPPSSIAGLEAAPDEYVPGTVSMSGAVTLASRKVEVHLKGHGSFRPITGKAAFKFKFAKTERPLGLKKMTLNNMVQDPSMIRETLAYAAFRAAGVPASRTGFAYLRVNGEDLGVYLDIETIDDLALEKLFGSFEAKKQHLYEGELGEDLFPGSASQFEVDEGDETHLEDLEALIVAVNSTGSSSWSARVAPFADLGEMARMWAVEKYSGQWDGYAGQQSQYQPSNYLLFSDLGGSFKMLPWGTDQTWQSSNHLKFDGKAGLLFDLCRADPDCARVYWEALSASRGAIATADLGSLATKTAALLAPWQQIEQEHGRPEHSSQQIADGVSEVKAFVAARPGEADTWLAVHKPPALPSPPLLATTEAAPVPPQPSPQLTLLGVRAGAGAVRARLNLLGPGQLTVRGQFSTRDGAVQACRGRATADQAGTVALACPLNRRALAHLRVRRLRITLTTRFVPLSGSPETLTTRLTLPRH